ncbi:MAG: hypothetical protein KAI26_07710 [Nanoarchaeota archaeon]|nr:hypothetical protein [Nanoarchaeota archaeon]
MGVRKSIIKFSFNKQSKIFRNIISILIPLFILGYIIYMNWLPCGYAKTFMLDVGSEEDILTGNFMYLDNKGFTPRQSYGVDTWRSPLFEKPVKIFFKPPILLDKDVNLSLSIDMTNNDTVYIKVFNPSINKTEWIPYYPAINDYVKLKEFNDSTVFVKREWLEFKCHRLNMKEDCSNIENYYKEFFSDEEYLKLWIEKNIPPFNSLGFFARIINKSKYINKDVGFKEKIITDINVSLRGTHKFYVYLKDKLYLSLTKEDLNSYYGEDSVSIELRDLQGKLVYSSIFKDDGIIDDSRMKKPQTEIFETAGLKEGTYVLSINFIRGGNDGEDFIIRNIKINTNKIMTIDRVLNTESLSLYTESLMPEQVSFYYWHKGKEQNITVSGEQNLTIQLTQEDISRQIHCNLGGKNHLYLPKGYVEIKSNLNWAFNEENYFYPYSYKLNQKVPSFAVAYKSLFISGDEITRDQEYNPYFEIKSNPSLEIHKLWLTLET